MYMQLIRRIAEAEQAHGEDDHETLKLAKQLDLRRCPECSTIIEKNEGCSSMACYLCGHTFRWNDAKRVKKKKKVKEYLAKGNAEMAREYAKQAITQHQSGMTFLTLSSKLDAVRSRMESAKSSQAMVPMMSKTVKSMDVSGGRRRCLPRPRPREHQPACTPPTHSVFPYTLRQP